MSDINLTLIDRNEWLRFAAQFLDYNYRQCWDYGQLLAQRRKAVSRHMCIRRGAEIIGLADVRIKQVPLLGGIAYISGGPLTRKGTPEDIENLGCCLEALRRQYVQKDGLILRIQGTLGAPAWNEQSAACFTMQGFGPASQGSAYCTLVVDLRPELADIRSSLAQKWRNCLNKAERSNPTPTVTTRIEDFDKFAALFNEFVGRKGFKVDLDADFYRNVQRQAAAAEALQLTTMEVNGKLAAGHMSSLLGDTCVYLLGATSDETLKTNAAYLLQWHVIKMAREKGAKWYDLGGIDPRDNPGVYHFKCGLGGVEMTAPGPFELVPDAVRSRLILHAECAYRRLRHHGKSSRREPSIPSAMHADRPAAESKVAL